MPGFFLTAFTKNRLTVGSSAGVPLLPTLEPQSRMPGSASQKQCGDGSPTQGWQVLNGTGGCQRPMPGSATAADDGKGLMREGGSNHKPLLGLAWGVGGWASPLSSGGAAGCETRHKHRWQFRCQQQLSVPILSPCRPPPSPGHSGPAGIRGPWAAGAAAPWEGAGRRPAARRRPRSPGPTPRRRSPPGSGLTGNALGGGRVD